MAEYVIRGTLKLTGVVFFVSGDTEEEAILNAEPSLESEELNYLLDKARIAQ